MRQANSDQWLESFKQPQRLDGTDPIATRFVLSVRLMAVYRKAKRDPVPELTNRLGNVSVAIAALDIVETMMRFWPEPIQVSRMCCQCLTHDEVTLARAVDAASHRDASIFRHQFEGLIRPRQIDILWEQMLSLVAAEYAAI